MKVNITYPHGKKSRPRRSDIISWARWPFLFAAYICPIVNLCTGGRAWSVIVLFSLFTVWTLVFSPDIVEYNRISQFIKLVSKSCVLLILIDLLIAPGWAAEVVPIVCLGGLIVVGVLFFSDLSRQRHNMLPMLVLAAAALIAAILGLIFLDGEKWPLAVMGALALALLVGCVYTLGGDMARELKKLFHTK